MSSNCILFFLKYPEIGKVKTRLALRVGEGPAVEAFTWMAEKCWHQAENNLCERQVIGSPPTRISDFDAWLTGGKSAIAQIDGTLGERLQAGILQAFQAGFSKVLCVGGDCPALGEHHYFEALEALDENDISIQPAHDGGYVMIGLKSPELRIFDGIAWSTDLVLQQTQEKAAALGLSAWIGSPMADIDTLEDWETEIAAKYPDAPQLA